MVARESKAGASSDAVGQMVPERVTVICTITISSNNTGGTMNELSFIAMMDNGGRRLWTDRRKAVSPDYTPDRRSGKDRRTGLDRRNLKKISLNIEKERRKKYIELNL